MMNRAISDMKAHALNEFPMECCGLVIEGDYHACTNVTHDPHKGFRFSPADASLIKYASHVIHSHVAGDDWPSRLDMEQQIETGIPWGIVLTDGKKANDPFFWGDSLPMQPLLKRGFRHGVADCYALLRDFYRTYRNVTLPVYPRDQEWWASGENMLNDLFEDAGFSEIEFSQLEWSDVVIGRVLGPVANHCAIYQGNGLILHHLSNRLSRHDPIGPWLKYATKFVRYHG